METPQGDRWRWDDPYKDDARMKSGAVLLAEDILRYIRKNVLVKTEDYDEGLKVGATLKGASYALTPHPADAWVFSSAGEAGSSTAEKGRVSARLLFRDKDARGEFYVVPPYTLVFVRLRQELRIPFYCIARHNLKIDYIYQGLLLGTGPQVDPGWYGRLIIPLHNLTREVVKLYINASFVSVDFVRTTPLTFASGLPLTEADLYRLYKDEKRLIPEDKLKRQGLHQYLPELAPRSAMGEIVEENASFRRDIARLRDDTLNRAAQFETKAQSDIDKHEKEVRASGERLTQYMQESAKENQESQEKMSTELRKRIRFDVGALVALIVALAGMLWQVRSFVQDSDVYEATRLDGLQSQTRTLSLNVTKLEDDRRKAAGEIDEKLKQLEARLAALDEELKLARVSRMAPRGR